MAENHHKKNKKVFFVKISMVGLVLVLATLSAVSAPASGQTETAGQSEQVKTFFSQFVTAGGPIVWFILLPMSVMTVYLMIDLCLRVQRKRLLPEGISGHIASIIRREGLRRISAGIPTGDDFVSCAIRDALAQPQCAGADQKHRQHLAAQSLQRQAMGLLRKVEWCNIIGSVAPMVGLFGTVFGMIRAFNLLGVSGGQPRPDQLAAAISIALITTFWGLLVAIPALAIAGIFRNRIEALVSEGAIEVQSLLGRITVTRRDRREQPNRADYDLPEQDRYPSKTVETKDRDEKRQVPITSVS